MNPQEQNETHSLVLTSLGIMLQSSGLAITPSPSMRLLPAPLPFRVWEIFLNDYKFVKKLISTAQSGVEWCRTGCAGVREWWMCIGSKAWAGASWCELGRAGLECVG